MYAKVPCSRLRVSEGIVGGEDLKGRRKKVRCLAKGAQRKKRSGTKSKKDEGMTDAVDHLDINWTADRRSCVPTAWLWHRYAACASSCAP